MPITGIWNCVIATPMGKIELAFDLTETDGVLTGTAAGENGTVDLYEGTVDGDTAVWKFKTVKPLPLTFAVKSVVDGDSLTGTANPGSFPGARMTATRA